ncbi:MAG: right-handed parallel beta-helix repeat-containing protein [Methanosarcinales archaeon]
MMSSNTKSGIGGKVLTAALLVLFFAASSAVVTSAVDIYVPEGGNQNIQQAVNNASTGDTIIVRDGTYNENVYVNVTKLAILSENGPGNCIVNAKNENTDVFFVAANYVTITGFTVQGATEFGYAGICLYGVGYCHISDNNVLNNGDGISILDSGYNSVANNIVTNNNYTGIYLELADENIVLGNTATNNGWEGIFLASSYNNTFIGNNASNNTIYEFYSDEYSQDNTVKDLQLCNNQTSVSFTYGNGAGLKSVDTVPTEPSEKLDISKYVETIEVCADSWLFLNMSYEEADLGCVVEDSLSMWEHTGTDWVEVAGTTGVNTAENYVYANITEFNIIAPLGDSNGVSFVPLGSSNGLNCTFGDICVNASGWWPDNGTFNASGTPIQLAINNASVGDTVYVYNGSYNVNVNVDKRLTLRGEGADVVTVTAKSAGDHVFEVSADSVNISGFNVTGATDENTAGIYIHENKVRCNISNNTVSNNNRGIYLHSSSNNTLMRNRVARNEDGIYLRSAGCNNITCNWVHYNTRAGFNLTGGSTDNKISYNNIVANGEHQVNGSYQWQFYNDQTEEVDAAHNWWGMDNSGTLNASIYDWPENHAKGNVTVLPRLDEPKLNSGAAAPCRPIPELSTVILLGIGLLLLAGYLRIRRKG